MNNKEQFENIDKSKHGKLHEFMTDNFRSMEIGGKQVIQTLDGEFIEYELMEEDYFVNNWLSQFAVGKVGKHNYFNHTEWSRLTKGFTKGVIVINQDKQPVVLIRKFIDMDLASDNQAYLDHFARLASNAAVMTNPEDVDQVINQFAEVTTKIASQNPDYDTLTAMIPYEYYLRHGVDPNVVKQVIWIRDEYTVDGKSIETDSELMNVVEATLYKNARGEPITEKEKAIVNELTRGEFVFNDDTNKVDNENQQAENTEPKEFDPFAD